jgi:hypothetical protein
MVGLGIISTIFGILFKIRYTTTEDFMKAEGMKRKS